jgi:hypothetical protein
LQISVESTTHLEEKLPDSYLYSQVWQDAMNRVVAIWETADAAKVRAIADDPTESPIVSAAADVWLRILALPGATAAWQKRFISGWAAFFR